MNFKNRISLVASAFFGLATLAFPNFATADPCWLSDTADPDHARKNSELVFIGTATAKWTETFESIDLPAGGGVVGERTVFKVHSVEKGDIEVGAELMIEKGKQCSCAGNFDVGQKYLVHARLLGAEKKPTLHLRTFNREIE